MNRTQLSRKCIAALFFFILLVSIIILDSFDPHAWARNRISSSQNPVTISSTDSVLYAAVHLNGTITNQTLAFVSRDEGILVDARSFCALTGCNYYPFFANSGLTVQYGKIISFAAVHYNRGFVACQMVDMLPPAEPMQDGVYAPLDFLARAIAGSAQFHAADTSIHITANPAAQIGDIISQTKGLADALRQSQNIVQQGSINRVNPIEMYYAGYTPDCQGNNVNAPYFLIQTPPAPGMPFVYAIPAIHYMRADEAFVIIGRTPPECAYYSYRSYLVNRYYEDATPHRKKIYASLGDTQNAYNIPEGRINTQAFNRFIVIISTADQKIATAIKSAAAQAGIPEDDIYLDIYPSEIVHLGIDQKADFLGYIHRTSLFANQQDAERYLQNPTLEILRITPESPVTPDFFPTPTLRTRGTGTTEFHLNEGMAQLRQAIIDQHGSGCEVMELQTSIWGAEWLLEGWEAIRQGANTLAEVRDTIYMLTETFEFNQDDRVVAYGVNHTKTNKAIYCNASFYGRTVWNGVGTITDRAYAGSATAYLGDTTLADSFYVCKFARTAIDQATIVIPTDVEKNYTGVDYGAPSVVGFRAYVEPATMVGCAPEEIIWDRAILFRPQNTRVKKNQQEIKPHQAELSAFPNPFNAQTGINLNVPENAKVRVHIFNLQGRLVRELWARENFAGAAALHWDSRDAANRLVSSGLYVIAVDLVNLNSNEQVRLARKILLVR